MYDPNNPFAYNADPLAFGPGAAYGMPSTPDPQKKRDLYARLFERFAGKTDPNAPYQMDDADKHHDFQRGLLQFAAAVSKPNGGNLANSLASGLLSGSNSMNDAQDQYANNAYRDDVMNRDKAGIAAQQAQKQAAQQFAKPDGSYDFNGYAGWLAQHGDPTAAIDMQDKARKMGVHEYGEPIYVKTADGKYEDPYVLDKTTGQYVPMSQAMGGQGAPQAAQAAPQGAPAPTPSAGGFDTAVGSLLQREGGYVADDAGHGPTNFGINSRANPGVDVASLTPDAAKDIYKKNYWDAIGADNLPPQIQNAAFDTAVNQGPGVAKQLLAQSGGDPAKFAQLRQAKYDALTAANPAKYGQYAQAWAARNQATAMGGVDSTAPTQTATVNVPPTAPVPFGRRAVKVDDSQLSPVDKRRRDISDLEAQGIKVTPQMRNQYLMTGKMPADEGGALPDDPTAGLSPSRAALVRKIANYDALPTSLGRSQDRADMIGRAAMINPDYNEASAKEAYTFKQDLGRSTPVSAGGQVTSINTALHHIGTMLQANDKLNKSGATSDLTFVNSLHNKYADNTGRSAVNTWNQTKVLLSEEVAKLVKGGVSSEGEVNKIMDNLSPDKSMETRNQALANLSKIMYGRIDSIESHKEQALGAMDDGHSLMTPEAQKILAATYKLGGEEPPAMLPPKPRTGKPVAPQAPSNIKPGAKYMRGQVIVHGGKQYRVVGGDPANPDLEEVR